MDRSRATDYVGSGNGPRTVKALVRGKKYHRYATNAGDEGRGSFLTTRRYESAQEAADALDLNSLPIEEQVVIIRDWPTPAFGIRSGIKDGANDAVQIMLLNRRIDHVDGTPRSLR